MRHLPTLSKEVVQTAVLLLAVLGVGFLLFSTPHIVTIHRTSEGFVPSHVYVRVGDTVRFVSDDTTRFWPASDNHPTHQLYSEFDSKKPVEPGESWSFTFTRAGTWRFHDHMKSESIGDIVVQGKPETTEECVARNAGKSTLFPECWEPEILNLMETKGFNATFARIDALYAEDPSFRSNCHDILHAVGKRAYDQYAHDRLVMDNPGTAYCGYGFYHGFIEAMQVVEGAGEFSVTRAYCEELKTVRSGASGPCYHGIGHALFDAVDGTLWGDPRAMTQSTLALCERAALDPEALSNCASGVYNSYANAMSAKNYSLSFEGLDVPAFCNLEKPAYQETCYSELGIGYMGEEHFTQSEAIAFIRTVPRAFAARLFYVYFSGVTKRSMGHLDQPSLVAACIALPLQEEKIACVSGVLQGVREESIQTNGYKINFAFCRLLPAGVLRNGCVTDIVAHAGSLRQEPAFQEACTAVPEIAAGTCRT